MDAYVHVQVATGHGYPFKLNWPGIVATLALVLINALPQKDLDEVADSMDEGAEVLPRGLGVEGLGCGRGPHCWAPPSAGGAASGRGRGLMDEGGGVVQRMDGWLCRGRRGSRPTRACILPGADAAPGAAVAAVQLPHGVCGRGWERRGAGALHAEAGVCRRGSGAWVGGRGKGGGDVVDVKCLAVIGAWCGRQKGLGPTPAACPDPACTMALVTQGSVLQCGFILASSMLFWAFRTDDGSSSYYTGF